MKNLEQENIRRDNGEIDPKVIKELEAKLCVSLPRVYVAFVSKHNGASLNTKDCFNFNRGGLKSSSGIAFLNVLKIIDDIESLLHQTTEDENDPNPFKFYHYFSKWLVPFGENGGGDFVCFDYRENNDTDSPKIIFWRHDAWNSGERISFVANNFEEFIKMLYEPSN
jgi:hypothetical protein